jgi:hypothetical protein
MVKFQVFWYVPTCRLVNSYDVLEQRATFVYGVCQFKTQRFVTKIFIVVNVTNVTILGVLYINFILTINGQVFIPVFCLVGYAVAQLVEGSIPGVPIGIFDWLNPSGRTMVLGSTQPLIETSIKDVSWR